MSAPKFNWLRENRNCADSILKCYFIKDQYKFVKFAKFAKMELSNLHIFHEFDKFTDFKTHQRNNVLTSKDYFSVE